MAPNTQLLRSAEALTMPGVQVIVLNANMRCLECRDRVSKVLSRMDNLLDYVVDVAEKKVTVRGRVDPNKRMQRIRLLANEEKRRKGIEFERLGDEDCSTDFEQQHSGSKWKVKATYNLRQWACCFRREPSN